MLSAFRRVYNLLIFCNMAGFAVLLAGEAIRCHVSNNLFCGVPTSNNGNCRFCTRALIKIVGATIGSPRVGQSPEVNENMIFGNSAYFAAVHYFRNGRAMLAPASMV